MNKTEQFAKLNNIDYFEDSGGCYPDFTDAKSILEVMEGRPDFGDFLIQKVGKLSLAESNRMYAYVEIYYVYNPDKLLDKAIEWSERNKP